MTNQHREENDRVLCSALQRYAQEESSNLPNAEELAGVTFTKAYEKRKRQILRAKGRPAGVKVLHGKPGKRVLRVGIVAALLAERYAPTYIPADYALETHQSDGDEYYCYRKDDGFLFWPGSYITFSQRYPGGTTIFYLENETLEEIEVEGLGKCLYIKIKNQENRAGLMWMKGPYRFHVFVDNLPKEELIKIAQSTKLQQN